MAVLEGANHVAGLRPQLRELRRPRCLEWTVAGEVHGQVGGDASPAGLGGDVEYPTPRGWDREKQPG